MTLRKSRRLFISLFLILKFLLLLLTVILEWGDAYTNEQMWDIRGIILPTLTASIVLFLKYLRKSEHEEEIKKKEMKKASKIEIWIIVTLTLFYFFWIVLGLLSLSASNESFALLKKSVIAIESLFGGIFAWFISDLEKEKTKE